MYLLLYGLGRFCVEFLRQNEQGGYGPFTTAQLFSLVFVGLSAVLFIRNRRGRHTENYGETLIYVDE